MPSTIEQIRADIEEASTPGFRGRLLARGQARAMIWRDGVLPEAAPDFSPQLSYDLHAYGYSLLGQGLRLKDLGDTESEYARRAFEQAAAALEATVAKGDRAERDRDFHFVVAASAYHLARLSARAYSLLSIVRGETNFSPIEKALAALMLRDFNRLETLAVRDRVSGEGSDGQLVQELRVRFNTVADGPRPAAEQDGSDVLIELLDRALIDNFLGAMATFLLALERGERFLVDRAITRLTEGLKVCGDVNLVPQWWAHKIATHLIDDLWACSFHTQLPVAPLGGDAPDWPRLRELFVATLHRRSRSEVDLWPSQLIAARRAADQSDDLVVSLPTSAGKTRISELCILRCLAAGKRVLFVTPLRALSAQTENTLQRTFGPLGTTISALYGNIGGIGFDEDALKARHIVVATPEKLDFALRNDPAILDDVGLLVFDEGHMIGHKEREVRYEVQIQRLLRRPDAQTRRIVCLSAILPEGEQLTDFANWLRRDRAGDVVRSLWRPTRLRYGELIWNPHTASARLNLRVGQEACFVPVFVQGFLPKNRKTRLFPKDIGEFCLATAWKLVEDGHSVLVFCPVRAHVEPFAKKIIDLHRGEALKSLLTTSEETLRPALTLGAEWLGDKHPILQCLRLGVVIHHGGLPTAYRKEVERLMRDGALKVTISSPTLAQGLNLTATAVVFHSLHRSKERISAAEFKNVVGRAGRAFVDAEGLVLYPMFNDRARRMAHWEALIADVTSRSMESGLVSLVGLLLKRMQDHLGDKSLPTLLEYVVNNAAAWIFPALPYENEEQRHIALKDWDTHVATLDTAILGLLGDRDVPVEAIATTLDEVLQSSLWERRLTRKPERIQEVIKQGLVSRSRYIWTHSTAISRRSYFLAGVGLNTGHALDAIAPDANRLLVKANIALMLGVPMAAIPEIALLAERVFEVSPFVPQAMPENWREILRVWLSGLPLTEAAGTNSPSEVSNFVEDALVYRLAWAMEAIRVRAISNGESEDPSDPFAPTLEDFDLSYAATAVATGTSNRSVALLIQAGFSSRLGAAKAVDDTQATFTNGAQLQQWLSSDLVLSLSLLPDWPTAATNELWHSFFRHHTPHSRGIWKIQEFSADVTWKPGMTPHDYTRLRIVSVNGQGIILTEDATPIGQLHAPLNPDRRGLLQAYKYAAVDKVHLHYVGPEDLWRI
jgi:late competence protein required for DNA uptake (superfamily II DNA/RNA helicase)